MNKIIVITGTSSGFGELMVHGFSRAGHTVIATMRGTTTKNSAVAEALGHLSNVEVLELDVTQDASVESAVGQILGRHGRIDVLINNAGVYGSGPLEGFSIAQFHKTMDINVYGVLRMYHAILPSMRARRAGLIINISSSAAQFALPLQAPYNASKHALEAIIEGSYAELINQGIESISLAPGAFPTELAGKGGYDADRTEIKGAYGTFYDDTMQMTGQQFGLALAKHQPDPQVVADLALELVSMPEGTRPMHTPVDPIAQGIEREFNLTATEIKRRWVGSYGL